MKKRSVAFVFASISLLSGYNSIFKKDVTLTLKGNIIIHFAITN